MKDEAGMTIEHEHEGGDVKEVDLFIERVHM